MIQIGRNPALGSLPLLVSLGAGASASLAALVSAIFESLGAGAWSWPAAFVAGWIVLTGAIVAGVSIAYGTVQWDPARKVVRLRGREVPVDTITEAWRTVGGQKGGAAYLVYRFVSTEGPSVRVLVAGTPMRGLDPDALKDLERFVAELPLQLPVSAEQNAVSDRQRAAAVSLMTGGGKSRVGKQTLLDELASASGWLAEPPGRIETLPDWLAEPPGRRTILEAGLREREWQADDEEALATLAANRSASRRARSLLFWLMLGAFLTAFLALPVAAMEDAAYVVRNSAATVFIISALVGACFALGWCVAADADVRHRRRLGRASLAARDEGGRERGMAPLYLFAWSEHPRKFAYALALVAGIIGLGLVSLGIIFFLGSSAPIPVAVAVLTLGLASVTGFGLIHAQSARHRRADAEEMVLLGGRRLLAGR
jgi:hypothetical protein